MNIVPSPQLSISVACDILQGKTISTLRCKPMQVNVTQRNFLIVKATPNDSSQALPQPT